MNRSENIQRLRQETFDLCIIGGGASGAGCALDAALRGLKVALVEKNDFASGTSSKSTKLIHGGVRYLEQAFKHLDFAQIRQVRHGLEERHILLQNAPHLAHPLSIVTPVGTWWESIYYGIGLRLYDWFASGKDHLPKSRRLSKAETLRRIPGLHENIYGAVQYYDGQLDDARYCLALVQSAAAAGAVVANHLEITGFQKNSAGTLTAANCRDLYLPGENCPDRELEFPIRASLFLNCTGPYADHIRRLANPAVEPRIRPSKGVHVMLPFDVLGSEDALLIPKTRDGRLVFAIPFESELLLGTTDEDYTHGDLEPVMEAREVEYLLETLQPFLKEKLNPSSIKAGFGGLRPLVSAAPRTPGQSKTKSLLRDHEVEHEPVSQLLSLLGGKWTTYRLMAKDAVDQVCLLLRMKRECRTESHLLHGGNGWTSDFWKKIKEKYGFNSDISQHLALKYGTFADVPAKLAIRHAELGERILPGFPFLKAEIVYAVRAEMACSIRDFLARRIRLEMTDWQAATEAAPVVARVMGQELGWTEYRMLEESDAYTALLAEFRKQADGNHVHG